MDLCILIIVSPVAARRGRLDNEKPKTPQSPPLMTPAITPSCSSSLAGHRIVAATDIGNVGRCTSSVKQLNRCSQPPQKSRQLFLEPWKDLCNRVTAQTSLKLQGQLNKFSAQIV
eukprot:TRINITY_DN302_c0_g1_i2.p1 TRINITY_DN302_c0_g1~~TRINITY_DN302_c0_g1_i2.p1  ORF type:complete len:115 (+),score=10.36 TRINITY_DN302_c0_g1_i2:473-817(+)